MQENNNSQSYRSIFKATSLFGGIQAYQILITIVKSKIVAVLLGPLGVGVQGLLTSATDMIKQITSLGISQSAVRDVSEANASQNQERVALIVTVLRRIVWWTGLLGMLSVMFLSPYLSKISFGNYDYTIPFIFLSVTLLLDQLCAGQKVLLQGMRRLKDLAKASAIGATIGLLVSVPIYYFFRIKGIVPTLILHSVTTLLLSWYFSRRIKLDKVEVTPKKILEEGKFMLRMGLAMSVSGILSTAASFVLRGLIRKWGGTEDVGLYQAGFVIINTYVGLVFSAMSTDYLPRLSAVNKDNDKCREIICQQGEVATLIMAPMLTFCIIFMPIVIFILYSDKFLPANDFIIWASLAMMFKLASWLISFEFVAKAESKLFMINELLANIYFLVLNIIGYKLYGLSGLGLSYLINYFIYFVQVYLIATKKYRFSFTKGFKVNFLIQLAILLACFVIAKLFNNWLVYIVGVPFIMVSLYHSLYNLNKQMDLSSFLKNRFKK